MPNQTLSDELQHHEKDSRVGIITLPFNQNIGGVLQGYALMKAIKDLGRSPVLIDRRHPLKDIPSSSDLEGLRNSDSLFASSYRLNKRFPTHSFVLEHILPVTRTFRDSADLARSIAKYKFDAVVAGSDQIWRARYAKTLLRDFFLGFIPDHESRTARISYAASFGTDKHAYSDSIEDIRYFAQRFDAISVREDVGINLCRDALGVPSVHVLDPTLLHEPDHYVNLYRQKGVDQAEKYVLAYILDSDREKLEALESLAAHKSLPLFSTNGQPYDAQSALQHLATNATVEGWIASFHNADYVVTDSYHGTIFSILFNRPFTVFGNPSRGLSRFSSLLRIFGLEDRLITSNFHRIHEQGVADINWTKVNEQIAAMRRSSYDFLSDSLTLKNNTAHPNSKGEDTQESSIILPQVRLKHIQISPLEQEIMDLATKDGQHYYNAISNKKAEGSHKARLMYAAHAVEKGLSHADFRTGFGQSTIKKLAKDTALWISRNKPRDDQFFLASLAALKHYFDRHQELQHDVSELWNLLSPEIRDHVSSANKSMAGVVPADSERGEIPCANSSSKFLEIVYGRRSIREFSNELVLDTDIEQAVAIALQAPSVCNRQASRVHHYNDPIMIRELVELQKGYKGYKDPPSLLLVTSDLSAFLFPKERNQAYVDGGLFMMLLLLGLRQVGLGSCPLNLSMESEREQNMRKITHIPSSEVFIAFIAVGHYDESTLVPRSIRYNPHHILTRH